MIPYCDSNTAIDRLKSGAATLEVAREAGQTKFRLRISDGSTLYRLKAKAFWEVLDRAPLALVFTRSRPTHITVYRYDFSARDEA